MDKVFEAIINNESDLGNYYQIRQLFDTLNRNKSTENVIMHHFNQFLELLKTVEYENTLQAHNQFIITFRQFAKRVTELLVIYNIQGNFLKNMYQDFYNQVFIHKDEDAFGCLENLKDITFQQVPELIQYIDNLTSFQYLFHEDKKTRFYDIVQKIVDTNADAICKSHHNKPFALYTRFLNLDFIEKYYIKYLQIRLLNGANTDTELSNNKKFLYSKRAEAIINDTIKSRIIASKTSVCKPIILNENLWDIVNDMKFTYPHCVLELINPSAQQIEERHDADVVWAEGLGTADVSIGKYTVSCNMYQFTAIIMINEGIGDRFQEETGCSPAFAKVVIESLIMAGIIDNDLTFNSTSCPIFIDANKYFVDLV